MKTMIKPCIFGSAAAIGLMLILCVGRNCPTFSWSQIALVIGCGLMLVSGHWLIKRAFDISEEDA